MTGGKVVKSSQATGQTQQHTFRYPGSKVQMVLYPIAVVFSYRSSKSSSSQYERNTPCVTRNSEHRLNRHTQNFTHSFSLVAHQVTSTNGPCKSEAKAWLKELLKLCCLHERNDGTEGIAAQSWLFFHWAGCRMRKNGVFFFVKSPSCIPKCAHNITLWFWSPKSTSKVEIFLGTHTDSPWRRHELIWLGGSRVI